MNSINITPKFISITCAHVRCEVKKLKKKQERTRKTENRVVENGKKYGNNKQEVIETNCIRPIAFVICDQLDSHSLYILHSVKFHIHTHTHSLTHAHVVFSSRFRAVVVVVSFCSETFWLYPVSLPFWMGRTCDMLRAYQAYFYKISFIARKINRKSSISVGKKMRQRKQKSNEHEHIPLTDCNITFDLTGNGQMLFMAVYSYTQMHRTSTKIH